MKLQKNHIVFACAMLLIAGIAFFASSNATQVIAQGQKEEAPSLDVVENANDPAIQMGLVPHKALYGIELASKKSGSQIVNINGQMFYDWSSGCEGWNSNHRFNLLYEYADTPPMKITSDFSTYETFDGENLNFTSQRKRNGELFEELRGIAHMSEEVQKAIYSMPEGLEFDLPPGTLFPMRHTMDVVEKLKSGQKFFKATIFDGSDEDGPLEINAFIGKRAEISEAVMQNENIDGALLENNAWNVQLAFFPMTSETAAADYEMKLTFHENGVISQMFVDYGDFSVSQNLIALEAVPQNGCMDLKESETQ
ncbi:MAG: EipB family protein [Alphaproteobacteria bacterium]